jgi:hypothetical protein
VDGYVVERCSSTATMVADLGGMVQQGLDDGHMTMEARRKVALSGTLVVSMAGLASLMHGSLF